MSDDNKAEQLDELESMQAIFPEYVKVIQDNPIIYTLVVASDESCSPDDESLTSTVTLRIAYTPGYPDEAPVVEIEGTICVNDEDKEVLKQFISSEIEENIGMPMIAVLQMSIKEYLDDCNKKQANATLEQRVRAKEEEEKKEANRFATGVPVTKETFLEWAANFKAEMERIRESTAKHVKKTKMTGKELFLSDKKMLTSDTAFFDDGDVEVDTRLFADLEVDDLPDDIEDE